MNKIKIIVFVLIIIVINSCKRNINKKIEFASNQKKEEIESYLNEQIKIHEIPGLALAVVKNNKVIYKGYFGVENFKKKNKINEETLFPVYSISKLITSTAVFQLIEEGKISLDYSISKYIKKLPRKWQDITVRNLITHSTGLPDFSLYEGNISDKEMLSKIAKYPIRFKKGNQWEYNQTNFWLVSKIIEKVTAISFDDFVLKNQFSQIKSGVLLSSDFTDEIPNRVYRYDFNNDLGELKKTDIIGGKRAHACNGLNISLDEMILWNKKLDDNILIKEDTKAKMWQPFKFKNDKKVFLHGWDSYLRNNIKSYGFTGGMQTGFRKFINQDMTIIFFTNGHKYYPIHNIVIEHVAGIIDSEIKYKPALLDEEIMTEFLKMNFENAKKTYLRVSKENPELSFEDTLNNLAYQFVPKHNLDYAIKMFELNTQIHPKSANAFDSLAESYFLNNQFEMSKTNYQKSLELNPENTNAKEMIVRIDKLKLIN